MKREEIWKLVDAGVSEELYFVSDIEKQLNSLRSSAFQLPEISLKEYGDIGHVYVAQFLDEFEETKSLILCHLTDTENVVVYNRNTGRIFVVDRWRNITGEL